VNAGAPLGLVLQALRGTLGVQVGEDRTAQRAKIEARVADRHVAELLAEMIGAPFDDASEATMTARRDPLAMADSTRLAWQDFVAQELDKGPLVFALDDLQWGDAPSLAFLDGALRLFRDRPLFVIAFARPEVNDIFPDLWRGRGTDHVELKELSRASSEKLVREVLGTAATDAVIARVVKLASGNTLYLEELIRAEAEGRGAETPATVKAMVEARLEALDGGTRRVLRAASVFGDVFWEAALARLIGGEDPRARLDDLTEREIIRRSPVARFSNQREYVFRQSLLRDVAYGTLTDADRELAHVLAGRWLEEVGETDAAIIAEHLERGGQRAVAHWHRAARAALQRNDLAAAIARAERGIRADAQGDTLAALRLIQVEADAWRGAPDAHSEEAMSAAVVGSETWWRAAGYAASARARARDATGFLMLAEALRGRPAIASTIAARTEALSRAMMGALGGGHTLLAHHLWEELLTGHEAMTNDHLALAWRENARAFETAFTGDNEGHAVARAAAAEHFVAAGHRRHACQANANLGSAYNELGLWEDAERTLREAHDDAERMGLASVRLLVAHNLGWTLAQLGKLDEARATETEAIDGYASYGDARMHGGSRLYRALILARAGDVAGAEREARAALEALVDVPPVRMWTLSVLAQNLLDQNRTEEARAASNEAMTIMQTLGHVDEGEILCRRVHAELLALTDKTAARAAIDDAAKRLLDRAARIRREDWRAAYLAISDHARTLDLARTMRA
jgi:tetratricopeptide (TPR) repeat protein